MRENGLPLLSAHEMGSVPTGASDRSPTEPDGRLRGAENVFVGDASVFPTAVGFNPMTTVMAMARRTAVAVVQAPGT